MKELTRLINELERLGNPRQEEISQWVFDLF